MKTHNKAISVGLQKAPLRCSMLFATADA